MVTQLPQRWPQIQSAYFDSDRSSKVVIRLPENPIDGQLVITTNVNDHNGFVGVGPPRHSGSTTEIIDPLTLTRGEQAEITGPNVSIWWQYRAEDDTWYPLGINNDRSQSIKVIDLAGANFNLDRTERSVEVISPGTLTLSEPQAIRHIYEIKNSCPGSTDIVTIKSSTGATNEIKFAEGFQVGSLILRRGESILLQSFGTYWLVINVAASPKRSVAPGYGGIMRNISSAFSDLGSGWVTIDTYDDELPNPVNVQQNQTDGWIKILSPGVWMLSVNLTFTHNVINAGRLTNCRIYDDTASAPHGGAIIVTPRDAEASTLSLCSPFNLPSASHELVLQLGGGDTYTDVAIEQVRYAVVNVSEGRELDGSFMYSTGSLLHKQSITGTASV